MNPFSSDEFQDAESDYFENEKWLQEEVYNKPMLTEEDYEAWEAEISKGKQIFSDEENVGVIENNPLEGF